MAMTRRECNAALSALAKQDYALLGLILEDTPNLTMAQKVDALGSVVQLASPGARIDYSDDARRLIDDLVSVINQEAAERAVRALAGMDGSS